MEKIIWSVIAGKSLFIGMYQESWCKNKIILLIPSIRLTTQIAPKSGNKILI